METGLFGSAFQILAAATGKARLPMVESLKGGTTRRLVPEERRERRPDTSVVGNAVEWSQIPGRDATENFVGQHGDLESGRSIAEITEGINVCRIVGRHGRVLSPIKVTRSR